MTIDKDLLSLILNLSKGETKSVPLPPQGSWPASIHLLDKAALLAIATALGANKPLLIRGEPGSGKSHMARAAARLLKRRFLSTVVQPMTEYQDLMWQFDHTQRLADAQLMSVRHDATTNNLDTIKAELSPENYTSPGPLWWAINWDDAKQQRCQTGYQPEPSTNDDDNSNTSPVLLIDEIDKADVSLSNGLLEVLGNGGFSVPHRAEPVQSNQPPLVIITSNSIRELPSAMLRRCIILDIHLPEGEALVEYLIKLGEAHFKTMDDTVLREAAKQIVDDRKAQGHERVKTGPAEYVDLLRAVEAASDDPEQQADWLQAMLPYVCKRQAQG
jgi:MoxR-like ATPase